MAQNVSPLMATHREVSEVHDLFANPHPDVASGARALAGLGLSFSVIFQLIMLGIQNFPTVVKIATTVLAAVREGKFDATTIAAIVAQFANAKVLLAQVLAILGLQLPSGE